MAAPTTTATTSSPLTLGIIGTNWITHDYVSHAHATGKWKLVAVYSRTEEKAREFAGRYEGGKVLHLSLFPISMHTNHIKNAISTNHINKS
jgi:hypothetical protein